MKLRVFLFSVAIGATLTSCSPYLYSNIDILQNGSMEDGINLPSNWFSSNPIFTGSSLSSHGGTKSILASTMIPSTDAFCQQVINTDLPIGNKLRLSVWIKAENVTGEGAAIAIRCDNSTTPQNTAEQFVTTQGTSQINGIFDWTEYTLELNEGVASGMQSITVYLILLDGTTGDLYFDDASLIY
jgi:hypothetical protein